MAQMQGTNMVASTDEILRTLERMADVLLKMTEKDYRTEQAKNLKKLANHVKLGGNISYNIIPVKFKNQLEESLRAAKIPWAIATSDGKDIAFMVKDSDKDKFLEVQNQVLKYSTDYTKNLTVENIMDDAKKGNHKNLVMINYDDPQMALIANRKLYQNGVVSAKHDKSILISPDSLFDQFGDFNDFKLDMSYIQATSDSYKATKKAQELYDKSQIETFATNIKQGIPMALVSATNKSDTHIFLDKDGCLYLSEKGQNPNLLNKNTLLLEAKEISGLTKEQLITQISKETEAIFDIKATTIEEKDKILSTNPDLLINNSNRPKFEGKDRTFNQQIAPAFQNMLGKIKMEANRHCLESPGFEKLSPEDKMARKSAYIVNLLQTSEAALDFADSPEKKDLLNDTIAHFSNDNEIGDKDETFVNILSVREIASSLFKDSTIKSVSDDIEL